MRWEGGPPRDERPRAERIGDLVVVLLGLIVLALLWA